MEKLPRKAGTSTHHDDDNDRGNGSMMSVLGGRKRGSTQLEPTRVKVIRDEETGRILRVVKDIEEEERQRRKNPLNDPLNDLSSEEEGEGDILEASGLVRGGNSSRKRSGVGIVPELEEAARYEKRKRPRKQSQREQDWIEGLVDRYGEDYGGMVRDRKLNAMQQSEGELRRRIAAWRRERKVGENDELVDEG